MPEHDRAPSEHAGNPLTDANAVSADEPNLPALATDPSDNVPALASRARAIRRGVDARNVAAGNSAKLRRHGVYATEHVKAEILDEVAMTYARAPHLDPIRDGPLVESFARMLVRLRRLDEALDGPEPTRDVLALAARLEGQVLRTAEALGLSPRSAAQLGIATLHGRDLARQAAEKTVARYRSRPRSGKP